MTPFCGSPLKKYIQWMLSLDRITHPSPPILATLLKDFEATYKSTQFARNSYPCSICLTTHKGAKCIQLSCTHIFCRSCLEDFWTLCITEGEISRVGCPDPQCVKSGREADAEEVARIVTEVGVRRWRWLRGKRDLEKGKLMDFYLSSDG